ncbi:MAG: acetate kinase [Desulfurococcaceae archaeon]
MKILVLNSGSSTVKFRVYDCEEALGELAGGIVERIGEEVSYVDYRGPRGGLRYEARIRDHGEALQHILRVLSDPSLGVIARPEEIAAVGHRVVHGGEMRESSVIDERVERVIEEYARMAPLHNPANLLGIRAAKSVFPHALHVAVFDTAFHSTLPEEAYLYAIPYEYYLKYRIRRYGFHGISHRYVARRAAELLGMPLEKLKLITCHLGSGASVAAVMYGKCVETSMGLTPLEGLVMGTRCGDIDPSIFYFLMKWEGLSADEVYDLLNRRSGLLGLSGISNDVRVLLQASERGDERAARALKVFAHRVKKYIGAYMAVMNGADAIVMTAGIGERSPAMRRMILEGLENLGIILDPVKNEQPEQHGGIISRDDSRVKVLVIPTNEELAIAEEVLMVLRRTLKNKA